MLEICRVPPEQPADISPDAGGTYEAYEAREKDVRLGGCLFAVKGDRGRILSLTAPSGDGAVGVALLGCVLSRMAAEGVRVAAAAETAADGCLLKSAGFRAAGGKWLLPLDKIAHPRCGA